MSRWEVKQHIYSRKWLAYPRDYHSLRPQTVVDASVPCVRMFHHHAEAVAYADRMARTREVVLPRNHDLKKSVHKDINGDLYANYSSANYWAQDNWNKGPKPLALALLALAEQEEHT
ncbi:hypothetical protein [Corynebacterium ureicelerivorans]|uniref:Uncharacterized protein n=1 Tax=Corynebacterium ureicelerivorans TaxID=401472 RepID=A0A077HHA6_9CORY|nr:hypothetical protein [Corynebacterium ureicelerivorans]AIL96408.1 hypothetical protein CUREI_03040 [Corynebacterium ureicelerivorans]AIL97812.1 hypothetical protein CUREI_11570 [Corynebacterium ureicelerivorans]